VRDYISRDLFASILKDEEHHADFVDTQFDLIERIGIERYTLLNSDAAPDQGH
jgi:bacterioferritin